MGRTPIAGAIAVIASLLSAACGGRLFDVLYEGADAGALGLVDAGLDTGSSLKCMGGDCAGAICCASVALDLSDGLHVSSASSACSATPCATGQYQLCASDNECVEAGCEGNPLGTGPNVCSRTCTPGETQCDLPETPGVQTCTARYQWGAPVPCTGETSQCVNGACVECAQYATQCSGGMVQTCDPSGHWGGLTPCPTGMRCANGTCV